MVVQEVSEWFGVLGQHKVVFM